MLHRMLGKQVSAKAGVRATPWRGRIGGESLAWDIIRRNMHRYSCLANEKEACANRGIRADIRQGRLQVAEEAALPVG